MTPAMLELALVVVGLAVVALVVAILTPDPRLRPLPKCRCGHAHGWHAGPHDDGRCAQCACRRYQTQPKETP